MTGPRVAHIVCSDGFAGVERYVASLAPRLACEGLEVAVIGGDPTRMPRTGAGVRTVAASTVAEALRALRRLGSPPDIVNTHMSKADIAGAVYCRLHPGCRLVSTRHFAARRGHSAAARAVLARVHARVDAQIAISAFVAQAVEGDSTVVHSGVESHDAPAVGREPVVLLVQRLEAEKAGDVALRAWAAGTARHRGWRMRIAGDGAQRQPLQALAHRLGLTGSVDFLGHRDDVTELMSHAGMLLAPTPREGLGLAVLEAMALGTPVVAAAAGGHLETVGAVADAAVFPPGDAVQAARMIDGLAADDQARAAYGRRLQECQRRRFTLPEQVRRTMAVYHEVLAA